MHVKNLHAYWRMEYVEIPQSQKSEKNDPFLNVADDDDPSSLVIFKSDFCYAILNKFPYNAGHAMVIPYRQVDDLQKLGEDEYADMCKSVRRMQKILIDSMHPDGFNIGYNLGSVAGAGIPNHIHCHIVPRWDGDTNFMPIIAGVKVLPHALEHLANKLRKFA